MDGRLALRFGIASPRGSRTLGASLGELNAVAGELERGLEEFLDLVGHGDG